MNENHERHEKHERGMKRKYTRDRVTLSKWVTIKSDQLVDCEKNIRAKSVGAFSLSGRY
jgi:hypothetical protein